MGIKYLSNDGLLFFWEQIKVIINSKVAKVEGKGLSTNDYTTDEKTKIAGIEAAAQANLIESIAVNNIDVIPSGKKVSLTLVTKTSELTNDSTFQSESQVTSAIATAIGGITSFEFELVANLPETGVAGTIYLVPNSGSGQNVKDEYIWVDSKWEKIGTTNVDLSGYVQKSELVAITNEEINIIVGS